MKKIVVPIDFSDTSKNAARFAVQMANDVGDSGVILYNVYERIAAGSDGTPLFNDEEARKNIAIAALTNLKVELQNFANVSITCMAEEGSLVEKLEKLVKDNHVDMIVMGINGATRLEQIMIGSSTLGVINRNICPVMIIPPEATYQKIKVVVFSSDFKNVAKTTPIDALKNVLNLFRPELYVVNVDDEHHVELTEHYKLERADLDKMLSGYNPDYAFIRLYDFAESITQFALDRKADLIITVPRKHSFLESLFKTSHTKKLAYHSHLPILALHE